MKIVERIVLAALMAFFAVTAVSHAGEYGHYNPWFFGIRDYFVPAKSGFYYAQYNLYYTSDDFRDKDGNSVNHFTLNASASDSTNRQRTISTPYGSVDVRTSITGAAQLKADVDLDLKFESGGTAPTLIYVNDWEFIGTKYAAYVSVPAVYTRFKADVRANLEVDLGLSGTVSLAGPGGTTIERSAGVAKTFTREHLAGVDDSQTGLGDIFIQPIWLGWNGKHFAASLAYGLWMPTGNYDVSDMDNTGMGFWTHQFQAAGAWYPLENQATAITLATTYELHSDKEDKDIRPGSRFTVNYGVSQLLPLNNEQTMLADVGLCGYNQWQVSDDSGSEARNPNVHDRVFGYGLQAGLALMKYNANFTLRWMQEYGARDHFQGDYYGLNFAIKF